MSASLEDQYGDAVEQDDENEEYDSGGEKCASVCSGSICNFHGDIAGEGTGC
jgi:hypothetical protein